jgi:hypothetical protein
MESIIPIEQIERRIYLIRGHKVMLDVDLAALYGVTTKRLNQQVSRNRRRFPEDFMFQLTADEAESLRLHFATSNMGRGGRRYLPYVFTEYGAVMLSSVLNTPVAIETSVKIARAFVRLREMISTHKEFAQKLQELERKTQGHDVHIQNIFSAIRRLMAGPKRSPLKIGFKP